MSNYTNKYMTKITYAMISEHECTQVRNLSTIKKFNIIGLATLQINILPFLL